MTNKVFVALVVCLHARLYSRLSSPIVNVSQRPSQIKGNTSPAFCFLKKRFAISDAKINIHIGEQLLYIQMFSEKSEVKLKGGRQKLLSGFFPPFPLRVFGQDDFPLRGGEYPPLSVKEKIR